ncbi:hypothetical protein [Acinetobacter nectaris]|uniref:hypothetical protein n=1 Tax=Acinetobacter nectaris TaxID=1219382 RepID=UPI001F40D558|nr:hypothetical protein [Acinetobacter nectaris]MCF9035292.1 hypothetical protein [Acinetobacter nectaris]
MKANEFLNEYIGEILCVTLFIFTIPIVVISHERGEERFKALQDQERENVINICKVQKTYMVRGTTYACEGK